MIEESSWMNEELRIYRSTVRRFIENEFIPNQARWRQQQYPDIDAWTKAGKVGILLCDVPEEYGGSGGTFAHAAVIVEEIARVGVHFGAYTHNSMAQYIVAYATEEQKRNWLPRMARGELVGAIAFTEPAAGSDITAIKTTARREGDQYVINGSKTFITNGMHAGIVCLAVKTDPAAAGMKGVSLVIVETKDLAGYQVGRPLEKLGYHGQDTCEIFFNDVRIPTNNLLGSVEGRGISQVMETLNYERLSICTAAVATAEEAVEITTKYAKERMVFGKPLIELQNTRFKLAECKTEAHVARVFLDECIRRFIEGRSDAVMVAEAKYWLTECEGRIVDTCLQIHGGYGYMTEYLIARMWADSRVHRIGGGTGELMRESIGWSL